MLKSTLISMLIAIGVILLLVFCAVMIIMRYRKLNTLRTRAEETFMYMETYMKNRHQMIPKFIMYIKRATQLDTVIMDDVVNARNVACQTKSRDQKVLAEAELQRKLNILYNTIRNSTDIERDEAFDDYLAQMRTVESHVARTRIAYNEVVEEYNKAMSGFWSRWVTLMFGFDYEEEFDIEATALPSEYHL